MKRIIPILDTKMPNTCKTKVCHILSPSAHVASSSMGSSRVQTVDIKSKLLISPCAGEEVAITVASLDNDVKSARLALPEPTPLVIQSSQPEVQSVQHHDNSFPLFMGSLSSHLSHLLCSRDLPSRMCS